MFSMRRQKTARSTCRNVLPEGSADVFPEFKLGWIDARAFSEPLGEKTKRSLVSLTKVFLGIYSGEVLERNNLHDN